MVAGLASRRQASVKQTHGSNNWSIEIFPFFPYRQGVYSNKSIGGRVSCGRLLAAVRNFIDMSHGGKHGP